MAGALLLAACSLERSDRRWRAGGERERRSGRCGGNERSERRFLRPRGAAVHVHTARAAGRLARDGDPIELFRPPQGGHVLLVGARVKGSRAIHQLRVRVRIPNTGNPRGESHTVVMEAVPENRCQQNDRRTNSQVAHIAVCPDYDPRDIVGTNSASRSRSPSSTRILRRVRPRSSSCRPACKADPSKAQCECECSANYVLGRCGGVGGRRVRLEHRRPDAARD